MQPDTAYVVVFFLDSQGEFLYSFSPGKQGHILLKGTSLLEKWKK